MEEAETLLRLCSIMHTRSNCTTPRIRTTHPSSHRRTIIRDLPSTPTASPRHRLSRRRPRDRPVPFTTRTIGRVLLRHHRTSNPRNRREPPCPCRYLRARLAGATTSTTTLVRLATATLPCPRTSRRISPTTREGTARLHLRRTGDRTAAVGRSLTDTSPPTQKVEAAVADSKVEDRRGGGRRPTPTADPRTHLLPRTTTTAMVKVLCLRRRSTRRTIPTPMEVGPRPTITAHSNHPSYSLRAAATTSRGP